MDRHTLVYAYKKSSAPLGRSLLSRFLLFDSIACACLFPMENISTYCRPLSTVCTDRQTDAPSANLRFCDAFNAHHAIQITSIVWLVSQNVLTITLYPIFSYMIPCCGRNSMCGFTQRKEKL